MSGVDFLLKLHREGRIDASDIKKPWMNYSQQLKLLSQFNHVH